jgi:hypothetical protein
MQQHSRVSSTPHRHCRDRRLQGRRPCTALIRGYHSSASLASPPLPHRRSIVRCYPSPLMGSRASVKENYEEPRSTMPPWPRSRPPPSHVVVARRTPESPNVRVSRHPTSDRCRGNRDPRRSTAFCEPTLGQPFCPLAFPDSDPPRVGREATRYLHGPATRARATI